MAAATPLPFDPVLAALDRAPLGQPLSPAQEAEYAIRLEELRSGRVPAVPHAEVHRRLEERRIFEEKHGPAAWLRSLGMNEDEVQKALEEQALDE